MSEVPLCKKHDESKNWIGKQWKCRSCQREYQAAWFKDNKESQYRTVAALKARYKKEARQFIWEYKSQHPCSDCGEPDPIVLDFDHIDPDKKSYSITDGVNHGYTIRKLSREIDKCVIRCANCHRRRTAEQFGWYDKL